MKSRFSTVMATGTLPLSATKPCDSMQVGLLHERSPVRIMAKSATGMSALRSVQLRAAATSRPISVMQTWFSPLVAITVYHSIGSSGTEETTVTECPPIVSMVKDGCLPCTRANMSAPVDDSRIGTVCSAGADAQSLTLMLKANTLPSVTKRGIGEATAADAVGILVTEGANTAFGAMASKYKASERAATGGKAAGGPAARGATAAAAASSSSSRPAAAATRHCPALVDAMWRGGDDLSPSLCNRL
mmetsp:Transcript_74710/g.205966  ORF Transcript_74710/g.205966 Transcript_74710/m.205966 type:complete len:246 (-) Transcript_74710:120-857(-)